MIISLNENLSVLINDCDTESLLAYEKIVKNLPDCIKFCYENLSITLFLPKSAMIDPMYRFIFQETKSEFNRNNNNLLNKFILNFTKSAQSNLDQPLKQILEIGEVLEDHEFLSMEEIDEWGILFSKNEQLSKEESNLIVNLLLFYRQMVDADVKSLNSCRNNVMNFMGLSKDMVDLYSGKITIYKETVDIKKVVEGLKYLPEHLSKQKG